MYRKYVVQKILGPVCTFNLPGFTTQSQSNADACMNAYVNLVVVSLVFKNKIIVYLIQSHVFESYVIL